MGNRVQATVRNHDIKKFQPILDEGACYRITNFGIGENSGNFPLLEHRFKLSFFKNTALTRVESFDSNPRGFRFESILVLSHQENSLRENFRVDKVNERMLAKLPSRERVFYSSDSVSDVDIDFNFNESLYTTEFLNTIKMFGIPHHKLVLKIGVPVMCMRNIDQRGGLCNGTRLQVLRMSKINIECKIISGGKVGTVVAIPRMNISPSDKKMSFQLNRRQFPVALCFAMTINKSQGQTMSKVGLFLEKPVFSHGQLYVVVSRVKSKKAIPIAIIISLESTTPTTHHYQFHSTGWFRESSKWDDVNNRFIVSFTDSGGLGVVNVPKDHKSDVVLEEVVVVENTDLYGNGTCGVFIDRPRNRAVVAIADVFGNRFSAVAAYDLTSWERLFFTQLSVPGSVLFLFS
ncbi:ATP-dependent DNA helicase PIF1-like protein [Tanacetum coccineum]